MKKVFIFFVLIMFFSFTNSATIDEYLKNDIQEYDLPSNVKVLTLYDLVHYNQEFGEWVESSKIKKRSISFDNHGRKIIEINYGQDGSILREDKYENNYDENKLIKKTRYESNGSINYLNIYKYDADEKLIFVEVYDRNGNLINKEVFEYNNEGLLIGEFTLNSDDEINSEKYSYFYDQNKNLIRVVQIGRNGKIRSIEINDISYDTNVRKLKIQNTRLDSSLSGLGVHNFTYSQDGFLEKEEILYYSGEKKNINYNSDGKIVRTEEIDSNSSMRAWFEYVYDKGGYATLEMSFNSTTNETYYHEYVNIYDENGRIILRTREYNDRGRDVGYRDNYLYDNEGNNILINRESLSDGIWNFSSSITCVFEDSRLLERYYKHYDGTITQRNVYRYNSDGLVSEMDWYDREVLTRTYYYKYNNAGDMIEQIYDNYRFVYELKYDENENLIRKEDYSSFYTKSVEYVYSDDGLLIEIIETIIK